MRCRSRAALLITSRVLKLGFDPRDAAVWSCLCLPSAVLAVLGLWVYLSCALV